MMLNFYLLLHHKMNYLLSHKYQLYRKQVYLKNIHQLYMKQDYLKNTHQLYTKLIVL
jgi:hypothetical protein